MREIKFRAWDNWQFKYFDLDALEDRKVTISDENFNTVTNCIINQYTWIRDKNWKEIYEGDLIQYSIQWYVQAIYYEVKDIQDIRLQMNRDDNYYCRDEDIIIVGNIYENTEIKLGRTSEPI